jgi:mannonate dehydratase
MRCYREIGFDGPIRPDHAPTMDGERNERPGYEIMGRIFAVGYMKGLLESTRQATSPVAGGP